MEYIACQDPRSTLLLFLKFRFESLFLARKVTGTFEKRAPDLTPDPENTLPVPDLDVVTKLGSYSAGCVEVDGKCLER